MRHLKLLAVAALALAAAACSGAKREVPSAIDKMPRGDVEAIVKDYLIKNPEVIIESLNAYQKREEDKEQQKKVALAAKLATEKSNDYPTLGPANAKITLSVFFDYNCPHCKEAYPWIFAALDDKRHDVRVVFKEYPILHPTSVEAAKAALAADKQGKYREMHLALMHARDLSDENIEKAAQSIGLDMDRWRKDKESTGTAQQLVLVKQQADSANISGTPAIFLNGELLEGFNEQPADAMMKKVRDKLKGA